MIGKLEDGPQSVTPLAVSRHGQALTLRQGLSRKHKRKTHGVGRTLQSSFCVELLFKTSFKEPSVYANSYSGRSAIIKVGVPTQKPKWLSRKLSAK